MHLQNGSTSSSNHEIKKILDWILKIGDENISEPNDGYVDITNFKGVLNI